MRTWVRSAVFCPEDALQQSESAFFWDTLYVTIFTASDEDKLKWAFRLYDMDNNGVIDMDEMAAIIETLDCIEGVKPGELVTKKISLDTAQPTKSSYTFWFS